MNGLAEDAQQARGARARTSRSSSTPTTRPTAACVPSRIIRDLKRRGGRALIGLVGVQSNQFPRAVDLARRFARPACRSGIGGFHVSGCLAMLPELPPEIVEAQALGISMFAGEAEERRLDEVLRDAWTGTLKPLYNFMDDLPSLEGEPPPILPRKHVERTSGHAIRASISAAAARTSARSAPSSTCRAARAASASPTISSRSSARTTRRASPRSSSPTTISPATAIGRRCSTGMIELREGEGIERRLHHPGRHALPQDPELHREGDAGRRRPRVHRAREHQPRQSASPPRSGRTRSPNTA